MATAAHDESLGGSRRALLFVLGSAFKGLAIAESVTVIFANESWYHERPEPEQEQTGILERRKPETGPNSRSALRYSFRARKRSLDVYAPGTDRLSRFVGAPITALGKIVDLRSEGFGVEFWIASIRTE
jgi:hypothetical protein